MANPFEPQFSSAPAVEKEEKPIECKTVEWGPGSGGKIFQIYLKSDDPRFRRVEEVYQKLHPEGHGMGVSTTEFSDHSGLPLAEAREKAASLVEKVKAPDFLKKVEASFAEFKRVKKALKQLERQLEDDELEYEDYDEQEEALMDEFEKTKEALIEVMPGTTGY
jgi:hypothetical protein